MFRRLALTAALGCLTSFLPAHAQQSAIVLRSPTFSYAAPFTNGRLEVSFPLPTSTSTLLRISPYEGEAFELVLPNGTVVTESEAASRGMEVVRTEGTDVNPLIARGPTLLLSLPNPIPGFYRLRLTKGSRSLNPQTLVEVLSTGTGIEAGLAVGAQGVSERSYMVGEAIPTAFFLLQAGNPLPNGQVRLDILKGEAANAYQRSLTLTDDGQNGDARTGDGIYSGNFILNEPGNYLLSTTVTGTNRNGEAFALRDVKRVEVVASDLRLTGTFQDSGVDTDGDGLLNQVKLTLSATGSARPDRDYYISLVLQNAAGNSLVVTSTPDAPLDLILPVGSQNASTSTPETAGYPTTLQGLGATGPIKIAEARLYRAVPGSSFPETLLDVRRNLGTLASYDPQTFQRPLLSLGTLEYVRTDDFSRNDKIDAITFGVRFFSRIPDYDYVNYSADLQAPDGQTLDTITGIYLLPPNSSAVPPLQFSGYAVGASGKDGPYKLANVFVYRAYNFVDRSQFGYAEVAGESPALKASQFDGYIAPATTPVRPILECVSPNPDGTFTAYFGYRNDNTGPVNVEVGNTNKFTPGPLDRGQPTVFQAGRTPYYPNAAFSIRFDGNNLVWNLLGRTSTASRNSTRCTP